MNRTQGEALRRLFLALKEGRLAQFRAASSVYYYCKLMWFKALSFFMQHLSVIKTFFWFQAILFLIVVPRTTWTDTLARQPGDSFQEGRG